MRCARDECDNTELTTKTATTTRTLTCSCGPSCSSSGSWFSRCHWCRTPQRPARWFHSSTAFHHANATPIAKCFPSGCCSPIVSCHRPLNLYPKLLHISHRENGSSEVLSLQQMAKQVLRECCVYRCGQACCWQVLRKCFCGATWKIAG